MAFTAQTAALLVLIGFAVGAFGTVVGAGGGFILTPILLLLYPHESAQTLTAISLAVVFFNAASGSAAYARQRESTTEPARSSPSPPSPARSEAHSWSAWSRGKPSTRSWVSFSPPSPSG